MDPLAPRRRSLAAVLLAALLAARAAAQGGARAAAGAARASAVAAPAAGASYGAGRPGAQAPELAAPRTAPARAAIPRLRDLSVPGAALGGAALEDVAPAPGLDYADDPVARMTGAVSRRHADPGPLKRMWFVHGARRELERAADMLERVRQANPGVEIVFYKDEEVLPESARHGEPMPPARARALFERILEEGADAVIASNYDMYEAFRALRDLGYAREVPFGFTGRRFLSVDIPRRSLDPGALSDPRSLPHRRYLVLAAERGRWPLPPAQAVGGMEGAAATLEEALASRDAADPEEDGEGPSLFDRLNLRFSGQKDPEERRRLREAARRLANVLEKREIDVLAVESAEAARVAGEMKRLGYHLSLPLVWLGKEAPGDDSGLNLLLEPGAWVPAATHLRAASRPELAAALREAAGLERLPDNFGREGGVTVAGYERTSREVVRGSLPPGAPGSPRKYQAHFLLSSGNGTKAKGDANAYGHFGMGVEDESGVVRVWTVHYMDRRGGSFSGGSDPAQQPTLGEYLYRLHELPGVNGQPSVLAETSVGPVLDFVVRDLDEASVETMREMAAYLDTSHLEGQDRYDFTNTGGLTNCISLVTQLLRSAGYAIADSGTQAPADKALELFKGFSRRLLEGQVDPAAVDLIVWDRPAHSASEDYRIPSVPLGSPYLNFKKPWAEMSWTERIATVLRRPLEFLGVPDSISAVSELAARRVFVGPNSREPQVEERPASPLSRLREVGANVSRLRTERVPLMESRRALEAEALGRLGLQGFRVNPGQDLEALARERLGGPLELSPEERAALERTLKEHHDLDVRLTLNRFDEILERRLEAYLKLRVADPAGRRAARFERLRAPYEEVVAFRERIARENRILAPAEIDRLAEVNEAAEGELAALRRDLLDELDPPPPQDIRLIFRGQVSSEMLRDLERLRKPGDAEDKKRPVP